MHHIIPDDTSLCQKKHTHTNKQAIQWCNFIHENKPKWLFIHSTRNWRTMQVMRIPKNPHTHSQSIRKWSHFSYISSCIMVFFLSIIVVVLYFCTQWNALFQVNNIFYSQNELVALCTIICNLFELEWHLLWCIHCLRSLRFYYIHRQQAMKSFQCRFDTIIIWSLIERVKKTTIHLNEYSFVRFFFINSKPVVFFFLGWKMNYMSKNEKGVFDYNWYGIYSNFFILDSSRSKWQKLEGNAFSVILTASNLNWLFHV